MFRGSRDVEKPAGEWNHIRLLISPAKCEHEINGVKYFEYVIGSEDFNKLVDELPLVVGGAMRSPSASSTVTTSPASSARLGVLVLRSMAFSLAVERACMQNAHSRMNRILPAAHMADKRKRRIRCMSWAHG